MDNKNQTITHILKQSSDQSKKYMQYLRQFIETFKIKLCNREDPHNKSQCMNWHNQNDKRRYPYDESTMAYSPFNQCTCVQIHSEKCQNCLNDFERIYHPFVYKIQLCNNQSCFQKILCPFQHQQDRIHSQYGQFFRFDLNHFKTKPCPQKNLKNNKYPQDHQRKVCIYYHNDKDKRRPYFSHYSHMMCTNSLYNCNSNCNFSHNRIEQLYHPSRYKSKFCKFYPNKIQKCEFRQFCSFAHTQNEITINLIHLIDRNTDFYMYIYKTVWCPYTENHDRGKCVYAHNFQDYRRDPIQYKYKSEKCTSWNFSSDDIKSIEQAGCKNGMKCDKSHGWMQPKYHPSILKKTKQRKLSDSKQIIQSIVQNEKSKIGNKFSGIYKIGSPFFKNDRQISQTSKKTKAKTFNNTSDRSNDESSVKDRDEYIKSEKYNQDAVSLNFFLQDSDVWKDHKINNQKNKEQNQSASISRAKSLGKPQEYDINYSKSIKDMFDQTSILSKLKNKRINQLKIINLKDKQIKTFDFLNQTQKQILTRKIQQYCLKRDPNVIIYSSDLTKYFVKKRCQKILEKMRNKKVHQRKLLNLLTNQIQELSFLTIQQKQQLPKLIRQFSNHKQFDDLNQLIMGQTKNNK